MLDCTCGYTPVQRQPALPKSGRTHVECPACGRRGTAEIDPVAVRYTWDRMMLAEKVLAQLYVYKRQRARVVALRKGADSYGSLRNAQWDRQFALDDLEALC